MENNELVSSIFDYKQAIETAIELTNTYNKLYCVIREFSGYSIVGEKFAKDNNLTVEYTTKILTDVLRK